MSEDLLEVVEDIVVGGGCVAHYEVLRAHLGYLGDGGFVYVEIECGDEISTVNEEDVLTVDFLFFDFCRKFDVEFRHYLEEQIERSAVRFDVIY